MTPLDKTLRREVSIDGRLFIVALSPDGIKITLKGKRNGQELKWKDLVSGDAALAVALNASLGDFARPASTSATMIGSAQTPTSQKRVPAVKSKAKQPPAKRRQ